MESLRVQVRREISLTRDTNKEQGDHYLEGNLMSASTQSPAHSCPDFNVEEVCSQLESMASSAEEKSEMTAARTMIAHEVNRLNEGIRQFQQSTSSSSRCRRWTTTHCASSGGLLPYSLPYAQANAGRVLVGWGGSSCVQVGRCRICFHYECRVDRISPD